MRQEGIQADFEIGKPIQLKHWILPLILALIIHFLFFIVQWEKLLPSTINRPQVEVQTISPDKLESIRKKWKEKSLLINPNAPESNEKEVPDNARYSSDRNIHVEKEQRARESQVLPKPGVPRPPKSSSPRSQTAPPHSLPKLGDLGVSFHFDQTAQKKWAKNQDQRELKTSDEEKVAANSSDQTSAQESDGSQQTILDRDLPTGGENLLNAQETVYYSFYARLYQAIAPIWESKVRSVPYQRKLTPGEYRTVVDVVLDSNGNLVQIRTLQGSGVIDLDQAVDFSWRTLDRFPNPPQGLLDLRKEVHIGWAFTVLVREGLGAAFLPPERKY